MTQYIKNRLWKVGRESVRNDSRDIGGVVAEKIEDGENHLAADMADDGHAVFTFGAFAFIESMDCRGFEGGDSGSEPDGVAKVG